MLYNLGEMTDPAPIDKTKEQTVEGENLTPGGQDVLTRASTDVIIEHTVDIHVQTAETKIDTSALAAEAKETERYKSPLITRELIKGTQLETTMLSVFSNSKFDQYSELKNKDANERIDIIYSKIDRVVTKFLERKFSIDSEEPIPEHISKVLVPAIEWHLMEMLKEGGHETNVNFLSEILGGSDGNKGILDVGDIKSLGNGIVSIFNKYGNQYKSGKTLLNVIDFLSLPKNQEQTKKLKNPYELYEKVFKNNIFQNTFKTEGENVPGIVNINTITWEQFGLSDLQENLTQEQLQQKLDEGKEKMKTELGSIKMVNSPETVEKLLGVLNKADNFLSSTKKMGDELIDSIDSLGGVAQALNHSYGFNAWNTLKNLEKHPIIGGIITFCLSLLGFTGGIDGIEKSWKKRRLDKGLTDEKKNYIKENYDYYMEHKNISDNVLEEIKNKYEITIDTKYKEKFSIDTVTIEEQIRKNIEKNGSIINPSTLAAINTNTFKGKEMVEEVQEKGEKVLKLKKTTFSEEEIDEFIKEYMKTMISYFGKQEKLEKLKDSDTLAFSMIAGITLNKDDVIDGIESEVFLPSQFYNTSEIPTQENEGQEEKEIIFGDNLNYSTNENFPENKKEKIQVELKDSPINADDILNSCKKENIPIEYLMSIIKERTNYGKDSGSNEKKNLGKIREINNTEKIFATRQDGLDALARDIKERIEGYKGVYGGDKMPWISYLLENKGPDGKGFIPNVDNYKATNDFQGDTPPKGAFVTKKEETENIKAKVEEIRNNLNQ